MQKVDRTGISCITSISNTSEMKESILQLERGIAISNIAKQYTITSLIVKLLLMQKEDQRK